MQNSYYQEELSYLRQVGPEFARAHPELARFLADPSGSDPDVERLLEGVAFLCGRIRQKLDDELPEFTAGLISLLWPHYLRPVPSMSILEFLPEMDQMQAPYTVRTGAEYASVPIDGTRCRFRSCWPTVLRPWSILDVRWENAASAPPRLTLKFRASSKTVLGKLNLDVVRVHLSGDPAAAFALYLLLSAHVQDVAVSEGVPGKARKEIRLDVGQVVPAGLSGDEGIIPYPTRSLPGYRFLQEYLAFKDRFLFIDFKGLDSAVRSLGLTDDLELAVTFNRRMDDLPVVGRHDLRLHCTPIINLFDHPAEPIRLRHDRGRHLVQPSRSGLNDRRHAEIYSIEKVTGSSASANQESRVYPPFYSFSHAMADSPTESNYYQSHLVPNVVRGDTRWGTDTYISFVTGADPSELSDSETISIDTLCTNRDLAANLRRDDIRDPTDSSPPLTRFRNLTKPTPSLPPPLGKDLQWRLISHMSLNYLSLSDADHFKRLLQVYEFQSAHDAQRRMVFQRQLEGIVRLTSRYEERMVRGSPIRGVQIELELNEDHFSGEGDAYLFGVVVDRFMGGYVSLNSYVQLTLRFSRSNQVYRLPAHSGEQPTPASDGYGTTH